MKVFVYRNLNSKCLSIRAVDGEFKGKVIGHASSVWLENVRTRVSEAGRQRVITEGRKNVHAGLEGDLMGAFGWLARYPVEMTAMVASVPFPVSGGSEITYNPYKYSCFIEKSTEWYVHRMAKSIVDACGSIYGWRLGYQ